MALNAPKPVTLATVFVGCAALLALAAPPLSAACPTCTVSTGPHPPDLDLSGTSGGTCGQSWIGFFLDDGSVGTTKSCLEPSCSHNTTVDISCRRTGVHKVHAGCICGVSGTNPDGTPNCSGDTVDAVTSLAINTTPTVAPSVTGPDASGAATLTTAYSFPNTRTALQRFLAAFDLRQGQQLGASFTPTESAGNWILPLDTACWKQGSHQLKVVAIACGQDSDPLYIGEAFTTLTVNHEPQVSVSVEPAAGGGWATVHYSFPQTRSAAQRFVAVWAYPAQDLVMSFLAAEQEGERTAFVSCADGAHRLLVADALACNEVLRSGAAALPNCPKPPRKDDCNKRDECNRCTGPDGGVAVGGGGPAFGAGKALGPGAELYYLAGGVGSPGSPGQAAWSTTLGRYWVHSYSERIVPATADLRRVWFLTQFGSFRDYTDANGDGLYETVSPEDEYRTLTRTSSGWELRDLAGTVTSYNAAGLWLGQQDRHGNTKTATYSEGRLASVSFPDGRSELFSYDAASGKLAAITEVGVGGAEQRTWSYTWSDEDLIQVDRPDGISRRFVYGDPRLPGYITRAILVGADDGDPATARPERVEGAWEYDVESNVVRTWRGADDFTTGVDRYELAYDNPFEPRQTTVTIYRNATEKDVVVYNLSRTAQWVGAKARVTAISGDCPACGLGPGSTLFYDDAQNPFRPTRIVDGRDIETQLSYDANGQVVSKTEAAGTPESRTTEWEYHPTYPALATRINMPSTSGGAALRSTVLGYDAAGNLTSRRQQGVEDGSFFDLDTVTTFNGAGQPLSIDPPGYGTADQTSFAYDPSRGDLLPLTRTDPLIGPTTFEHDAFNRRTAVVDPNGLRTETTYDAGNRVTAVTQKGAVPAEDLVTTHTDTPFGDLFLTTLPRGNLIEYGYDAAGRLVSIERKPDAATPGERTLYTLDAAGNRIKEELQRWDGAAWLTESFTDFVYLNRCQLHKTIHADGKATEFSYDCNGNLHETWDENHPRDGEPPPGGGGDDCDEPPCEPPSSGGPNPPTQVYEYDALNRMLTVSQPWAGGGTAVTRYSYDLQDHLASVTDAEGNVTKYVYGDRDLMTDQVSPVSGTTSYHFNEHGELVEQTDERDITMRRTVDALDRVTFVDYLDNALDTTFTRDDPGVPFSKGRLTAISRTGSTVPYTYDRFGRILQDGELTYAHDKNGNRTEIGYPDDVTARWTHDFADREASLEIQVGAAAPQPIVTGSSYTPYGPLSGLALGNGLSEARSFNVRYFPSRIEVPGRLDQVYTTDAVGNITSQNRAVGPDHFLMTYAYQDPQYFLTEGNGPWGRQAWTYDRIGNRLSESSPSSGDPPAESFAYSYVLNAGGSNTPKLTRIDPAPGGDPGSFLAYTFDAAGNQTAVARSSGESCDRTSLLDYSAESRLSQLRTTDGTGTTELTYDGRGFLARSRLTFSTSPDFVQTEAVYSSEGLLLSRRYHQQVTRGGDLDTDPATMPVTKHSTHLFYFAGRPVAQLRRHQVGGGADELLFLTTDHLGVPILATDFSGTLVWEGGLSPFGEPFLFPRSAPPGEGDPPPIGDESAASPCEPVGQAGDSPALESAGLFLRYPGQWDDPSFHSHGLRGGLYYNVHRYYSPGTGRYTQPDPLVVARALEPYRYAGQRPNVLIDPLGLSAAQVSTSRGSNVACCSEAWSRGWFELPTGTGGAGAGGLVVCCDGVKIPCAWRPANLNPQYMTAFDDITSCIIQHEVRHYPDLPDCPQNICGVSLPQFDSANRKGESECAATTIHLSCLDRARHRCGGDSKCLEIIDITIGVVWYQQFSHGCS